MFLVCETWRCGTSNLSSMSTLDLLDSGELTFSNHTVSARCSSLHGWNHSVACFLQDDGLGFFSGFLSELIVSLPVLLDSLGIRFQHIVPFKRWLWSWEIAIKTGDREGPRWRFQYELLLNKSPKKFPRTSQEPSAQLSL